MEGRYPALGEDDEGDRETEMIIVIISIVGFLLVRWAERRWKEGKGV